MGAFGSLFVAPRSRLVVLLFVLVGAGLGFFDPCGSSRPLGVLGGMAFFVFWYGIFWLLFRAFRAVRGVL